MASLISYNFLVFYLYFNFFLGTFCLVTNMLYKIINNQVRENNRKTREILFAINERFDIVEDSFIENMDYSGILNEVNMIKIN